MFFPEQRLILTEGQVYISFDKKTLAFDWSPSYPCRFLVEELVESLFRHSALEPPG